MIEVRWTEQAADGLVAIKAFIGRDSVSRYATISGLGLMLPLANVELKLTALASEAAGSLRSPAALLMGAAA